MRNARLLVKGNWLAAAGLLLILAISACAPAAPEGGANVGAPTDVMEATTTAPALPETGGEAGAITPSVTVNDQEIVDGMVTVAEVVSAGPGWIVIHVDNAGSPGPVIGHAAVVEGSNMDVRVEIDASQATETLYAMLHTDAGAVGEYEFPGADGPVSVDGQMVTPPFTVTNLSGPGGEAGAAEMVEVVMQNDTFNPATITVPAGTTVVWTHQDGSEPHTVTADDGTFGSDDLNLGDSFEFTFDTPGTYTYYCQHHGGPGGVGMSGVVEVQ